MTIENFTSGSGTWTCPAGVTSVVVEVIAGGGGGGRGGALASGKGGGGGGAARKTLTVTPGVGYSYQVGAGGGAGTNGVDHGNGDGVGGTGTASWFSTSGTVFADPGQGGGTPGGGAGGAGGASGSCIGDTAASGETGGANANPDYGYGGAAASIGSLTGGARRTENGTSDAGVAGFAPGGGGSAGRGASSTPGGAGADGQIRLIYTPEYAGTLAAATLQLTPAFAGTYSAGSYSGSLAASTPQVTPAIAGSYYAPSYLAATLPVIDGDFAGAYTPPPVSGDLDADLPGILPAFDGAFMPPALGTLDVELPVLGAGFTGTYAAPAISGSLGADIPLLEALFSGVAGEAPPPISELTASSQMGMNLPAYLDFPGALQVAVDPAIIERAPSAVDLTLVAGPVGATVTFLIGATVVATSVVAESGNAGPITVSLDETYVAGTYTVTAQVTGWLDGTGTFEVLNSPDPDETGDETDDLPQIVPDTGHRWVLQDLAIDGLGSWTMPMNPRSMEPLPIGRNLDAQHTTNAGGGMFHFTEPVWRPQSWSFAGYCPDRLFRETLLEYAALRRRIYLIDHRERAWTVVLEGVEFETRKRQKNDDATWNDDAANYTVRCILQSREYTTPV